MKMLFITYLIHITDFSGDIPIEISSKYSTCLLLLVAKSTLVDWIKGSDKNSEKATKYEEDWCVYTVSKDENSSPNRKA